MSHSSVPFSSRSNIVQTPFKPQAEMVSASEHVYREIKHLILSGQLAGGTILTETQISSMLGVSRTPVREAFRQLCEYGMIVMEPRKRAVVASIEYSDATDIAKVRSYLEKMSCMLLAERDKSLINTDTLYSHALQIVRLVEEKKRAEAFEYESLFHLELAVQSGNKHLHGILERFDAKIQLLRLKQELSFEKLLHYGAQHILMVDMIRSGKFDELLSLMDRHIPLQFTIPD